MKISTICTLIATLLLLGSFLSVVNSQPSQDNLDIHEDKPEVSIKENRDRMYVLVNSSVYGPLEDKLERYKKDVEEVRDLNVKIFENNHSEAREIRSFLKNGYENDSLVGTFFVGNLPHAEFEMSNDFGEDRYTRFPIDLYYKDLDGTWRDTNSSGAYDEHVPGEGDLDPEIWFGRISIKTDWKDEVKLYDNYFEKVYQYRRGNLSLGDEALLYIDDDWTSWTEDYRSALSKLYPDIEVVNDEDKTNASDYEKKVKEGYEWIQIHCHANHSAKRHAFRDHGGPKGSGGNFTSRDLHEDGQRSLFQNVFTCGSADYTVENYLCGWYALTEDYGLANVGSTKSGSMLEFENYYEPLSNGKTLGEAMQIWWNDTVTDDLMGRSWFYGITNIGDPTLSPLEGGLEQYQLGVETQGEGRVKLDPNQDTYQYGTKVNLTAKPEDGWYFKGWSGDYEGEERNISITMNEGKKITANFEEYRDLRVSVAGEGHTSPEEGTHRCKKNEEVNLEATATENWYLDRWSGTDKTGNNITIVMDENESITAHFKRKVELVIDIEGEGAVEVDGKKVEDKWEVTYEPGKEIELQALPNEGYSFQNWTGDLSEDKEGLKITITVDENETIKANFEKEESESVPGFTPALTFLAVIGSVVLYRKKKHHTKYL